jgi:hypothetical protein
MITWVTLFLALVAGTHDVEIAADDTVTEIELRLDGQVVDVRHGPPWTFEVDFGRRLAPHRLEAVARDGEDREIARIRQRVNLPRPQAEARLALEEGGAGRYRSARLIWEAMGDVKLLEFKVFFDGEPLVVENPERIPLPQYDPETIHYLAAEIELEEELTARAAVTFGGRFGGSSESELTPVVVSWKKKQVPEEVPPPERMAGWFLHDGEPVRVFTVDRPPADVLVVRSHTADQWLQRLGRGGGDESWKPNEGPPPRRLIDDLGIGIREGDRLRFVCPQPDWTADRTGALFPATGDVSDLTPGLGFALTRLAACPPSEGEPERLADAVAAAGVLAAAGGHRRVVVLVLHPQARDASQNNPGPVRAYLEAIRVPLEVWTPVAGGGRWQETEPIGKPKKLRRRVEDLRRDLDRQLVIWLEGSWLPREIELSSEARQVLEWAG